MRLGKRKNKDCDSPATIRVEGALCNWKTTIVLLDKSRMFMSKKDKKIARLTIVKKAEIYV